MAKHDLGIATHRSQFAVAFIAILAAGLSTGPFAVAGPIRSESPQLVTGSPGALQVAIAGPGTVIIQVHPMAVADYNALPVADLPAVHASVGGTNNRRLSVSAGGFRYLFAWTVEGWAGWPIHPGTVQGKIDPTGLMGAAAVPPGGGDLTYSTIACANDADCQTAFGTLSGRCESATYCDPSWGDPNGLEADSFCRDTGDGPCGPMATACVVAAPSHICFGITAQPLADNGRPNHFAYTALDIPSNARGLYTVNMDLVDTFLHDFSPFEEIPTLREEGFEVEIQLGKCCSNFGPPLSDDTCELDLTRGECNTRPAPRVWTYGHSPGGNDCLVCADCASVVDEQPGGPCLGTCCDALDGICTEDVLEAHCLGTQHVWTRGATCAETDCDARPGACCDGDAFGTCSETTLAGCECERCTWYKLQACDEIECMHESIPTVSHWGLVVLALSLLIGAKVGFPRQAFRSSQ